jgi:translocation and assembly module TamB
MALDRFLETLGVPPATLAARVDADAELGWNDADIRAGSGHGTAWLRPLGAGTAVAGEVEARLAPPGLLHLTAEDLQVGHSTVRWQGPLTVGTWQPSWSVRADPAVLEELVPLVNAWVGRNVLPPDVEGRGELQVDLTGPWRQPGVVVRLEAQPLRWSPMEFDRVVAEGRISGDTLQLGPARFRVGDGGGEVEGRLWWGDEPGVDLDWRGQSIPLSSIAGWVDLASTVRGRVAFAGGLRGPLESPRGSWAVGVTDATLLGRPLGDGSGEVDLASGRFTFRGLDFTGGLDGEVWWDVPSGEIGGALDWSDLPLGGLDDALVALLGGEAALHARFRLPPSGLVEGRLEVVGRGSSATVEADAATVRAQAEILDAVTGEVALDRNVEGGLAGTGGVRLLAAEELLTRLAPKADVPLHGTGEATLEVRWPAGGEPSVDGRLLRLELALDQRPLVLREPATFTVSPHGLEVDGLHADLLGEEVFLRGGVSAGGELHGNLSGTLDALLLRFLLPDFEPAGRVTGVVEIHGDVDRPLFDGVAEARQLSFRLPGSRDVVAGIDGTLLLSADEIALDGMDFRFMHGQGRGGGTVSWRQGELRLDLAGNVAGVEMEVLPGLVPRLAGSWRLEGPVDDLELAGELTVQRAALARTDDPTSILLDWVEASEEVGPRGRGLGLDLHIQADETLEARTPFLHLTGSADLEVSGTTAEPGMVGSIELEEGGEFTFQGVRYELERGVLTFADPLRIDPDIDLEARAWIQSYLVTVQIHGTMDRLVPTVTSDPPLPQAEVYSLMALGFRDEALGGGAVGVGLASSVLTREINAELQRRASLLLPVDQLRVDPFAESATGNPTARVTLVKQLNPRWTLILQSNLSANREEVAVSRWFLGRGLFLEATRDIDGTYALDLKLRRRY